MTNPHCDLLSAFLLTIGVSVPLAFGGCLIFWRTLVVMTRQVSLQLATGR